MAEYDFRDNLITLSRFTTPTEAELAQCRLAEEGIESILGESATATWLNHVGPSLVGATLSVRQGDLRRARDVLADVLDSGADEADDEELSDYDADDWSGEDWSDEEDEQEYYEAPALTPPLSRAFRASIIGLLLFPPLLSAYALWIIINNRAWEPVKADDAVNWRLYPTLFLICMGTLIGWALWGNVLD